MSAGERADRVRVHKLLRELIRTHSLDLRGLVVYTEAASGAYLHTPLLAALAGADHVYAATRDSSYASAAEVERATLAAGDALGVCERVEVTRRYDPGHVRRSDIITNSGFVRPIDAQMVACMKPTAVVPLMWETWEFRDSDLDLEACRQAGVLVLGTNETDPPNDMHPYSVAMAVRLVFDLGLELYRTRLLLLGTGPGPRLIRQKLPALGSIVTWASNADGADISYHALPAWLERYAEELDTLILYEHQEDRCLLGSDGLVSFEEVARRNPALRVGHISGSIRVDELRASGLPFLPDDIAPFGFMSYQPYHLGPRPVLELYAAGLKVGEVMARARLRGLGPSDAARYALRHAPALDFDGGRRWS